MTKAFKMFYNAEQSVVYMPWRIDGLTLSYSFFKTAA